MGMSFAICVIRATVGISKVALGRSWRPVPEVQQSQSLSACRAGAGAAQAGLMYQQWQSKPRHVNLSATR